MADDAQAPDADDAGDNPDPVAGVLESWPLFDMGFEERDLPARLEAARLAAQAGRLDRIGELVPVRRLRDRHRLRIERVDEREAAEKCEVGAFLVLEADGIDADAGSAGLLGGARDLETVDDAERAIEPAATRHGIAVGADEDGLLPLGGRAIDRAEAIDRRVEPGRAKARGEPLPRLDVRRRERDAVDTGLVLPDAGEVPKVRQEPVAIDRDHARPFTAHRCGSRQ